MTYKTDKLSLKSQAIAGPRHWIYSDTGSAIASVVGAGFFSDGRSMGMKLGDLVDWSSASSPYDAESLVVHDVQTDDTGGQYASVKYTDTD
jgi:hypothetical protein